MENFVNFVPFIIISLIIGACGLLLYFVIISSRNANENKKQTNKPKSNKSEKLTQADKKSNQKAKKKTVDNRGGNRPSDKGFSPPWLMTNLKGHIGPVLDISLSSCGKYLASCGEEDPESDLKKSKKMEQRKENNKNKNRKESNANKNKKNQPSPKNSKSEQLKNKEYKALQEQQTSHHNNSSNSKNFAGNKEDTQPTTISRRQKKNHKRNNKKQNDINVKTEKKVEKEIGVPKERKKSINTQKRVEVVTPIQSIDSNLTFEKLFISFLNDLYVLTHEELKKWGFPLKSKIRQNCAEFYNHDAYNQSLTTGFDVNAREFVPSSSSSASDSSSETSEDCDDSSDVSTPISLSRCSSSSDIASECNLYDDKQINQNSSSECKCVRCGKGFFIFGNKYLTKENCRYHWGKIVGPFYSCCTKLSGSVGCEVSKKHVWNGLKKGYNGPIAGYVQTQLKEDPKTILKRSGTFGLYALDCEMCFTVTGLEATKVTVVNFNGKIVYDIYIKPENPIVDYNTRFSGITEKILNERPTKSLKQVQEDLLNIFNPYTILIGHGLENDLRALKLIHYTIVDTSIVFPHRGGWPFKQSLKTLTKYNLGKNIQVKSDGHDSYQDAWACMELMLAKAKKDWPFFAQLNV